MKSKDKVWVVDVIPDETQESGYRFNQGMQFLKDLSKEEQDFINESMKYGRSNR